MLVLPQWSTVYQHYKSLAFSQPWPRVRLLNNLKISIDHHRSEHVHVFVPFVPSSQVIQVKRCSYTPPRYSLYVLSQLWLWPTVTLMYG